MTTARTVAAATLVLLLGNPAFAAEGGDFINKTWVRFDHGLSRRNVVPFVLTPERTTIAELKRRAGGRG
jgi:hypothetical protein